MRTHLGWLAVAALLGSVIGVTVLRLGREYETTALPGGYYVVTDRWSGHTWTCGLDATRADADAGTHPARCP